VARAYLKRLILDDSSTHSTPAVQAGLATHPRVQFNFTLNGTSQDLPRRGAGNSGRAHLKF
jgi:hypothetical protein